MIKKSVAITFALCNVIIHTENISLIQEILRFLLLLLFLNLTKSNNLTKASQEMLKESN